MFVLFDHGTPAPLQAFLKVDHTVREAKAQGWDTNAATPGSYTEVDIPA